MEPKYSPDVIRRYRELDRAHRFHREIVSREPVTLDKDRIRLACGHEQEGDYGLYETVHKLREWGGGPSVRCHQCIEEWLRKESGPQGEGE